MTITNQESEDRPRRRGERGIFERPPGSNVWWIRFADANGRIRRQKVGPKGLAKRLYEKRKTQVREGKFFPETVTHAKGLKFADAMDEYIKRKEPVWKAGKEWERIGEKWKERFQGRDLSSIERADIMREISAFARGLKPGTVNRHLTLLKAFLRDAVANGEVAIDPARFIKKLRENNERVRFLSEAEEQRLMGALPQKYRAVVRFAIFTGMRRGEIFNLQLRDIDLATRNMVVREPKEGRIKRLPISQAAYDLLVSQLPREGTHQTLFDRVFAFDPHNFVNRVFIPAVRRAKIQDFRFHDLRHTFATRLIMKGSDLVTIGKLMGHHGTRMTDRYAHLSDERLRDAVELLTDTTTDTDGRDEQKSQWAVQVSNLRPPACKADALPLS
jgi:integrase